MRSICKSSINFLFAAIIMAGCNKIADLPVYQSGIPAVLTASSTTITPAITDSNKVALTLNWTYPNHAADPKTLKYIVQIDTAGRNFSQAVTKEVIGSLQATYTGNELNTILLNFGYPVSNASTMEVRVISSYGNNNERINSNAVTISMKGFSEPSTLTSSTTTVSGSVGTASQNALTLNWTAAFKSLNGVINYSVEVDSASKNFASPQSFAGGATVYTKSFTQKNINDAALAEGITAGAAGKLEFRIKAMTALGVVVYSNVVAITVNTYLPLIDYQFPKALWVAGNYQNWDPPTAPKIVDVSATGSTGTSYEGYINFNNPSPEFKIVKGNNWGAGDFGDAGGGKLGNGGDNLKLTEGSGVYLLKANTQAMTWSATKINTWGIIGNATIGGWDASTPMTFNSDGTYSITTTLIGGNELKFRANNDWGINFGDNKSNGGPDGIPEYNGDNILIPSSGTYVITLNLTSAGNYSYTIKKQ